MPVQLAATLAEIEEAYAHDGNTDIEQTGLIGEETLTRFDSKLWFAVRVGDLLLNRYRVLDKIANGGSSTIWLVEDVQTKEHLVLKIAIKSSGEDAREQQAFHLIEERVKENTIHPGLHCVQRPLRDFVVNSTRTGRHHCFLLTPSACHVEKAWQVLGDLPLTLIKQILVNTLRALDFLHTECSLIHTDIKLDNILFGFAGDAHVAKYVQQFKAYPERSKIHYGKDGDQYPVTKAKPFNITKTCFKRPLLNDLGESIRIPIVNRGWTGPRACSPRAFRAPEILLGRHFNATIDVWMIGCMTLQMLTGKVPILPHGVNQPWTKAYTLAQHHALLGPPPVVFLEQSASADTYWNETGEWVHPEHAVPDISLEGILSSVQDKQVRDLSLDFVRRCLQWLPMDRASASELATHPFTGQPRSELWRGMCVRTAAFE